MTEANSATKNSVALGLSRLVITTSTPYGLRWALGAWVVLSTAAWFSLVATLLSQPRLRARLQAVAQWIDRLMGGVLIALALLMLLNGG
jgi:threonine/homoserine/homoserine lactone efflux protein